MPRILCALLLAVAGCAALPQVDRRNGGPATLRVEPNGDAATWVRERRDALRAFVVDHGALLVRGLELRGAADAEEALRAFGGLMPTREAFAARQQYADGVYSSSPWPPNQVMCLHHELSYLREPPGFMMFACLEAPRDGGATPLADASAVLRALPAPVVERFEKEGWLLTRNYHEGIGASLFEAFGTDDRPSVEEYCRSHGIDFQWQGDGSLRTWQRRDAVVRHPFSRKKCWFNQVAFLSRWTMAPELREYLVDLYGEDGLPFDTSYGNGDPIEAEVIDTINDAYEANAMREKWSAGDLLFMDNLGTAHGREPYVGPREVLVAMADPARVEA